MKCVRVSLVASLALLGSCSSLFGERGPASSAGRAKTVAQSQKAKPANPAAPVENLSHLPTWIHPSQRDLESSRGLVEAVRFLAQGEAERASVQLQQVRSAARFDSEVTALHAWALLETGDAGAASAVAREGIATYGATPALGYAMAVIFEAQEMPAEALALYRDLATLADAKDNSMLVACARTAVNARRGVEAMQYLDRWLLSAPLGLDGKRLRAKALQLTGRDDEALALYQQMVNDWPQDFALLAEMAEAAFATSQSSQQVEHLELAVALLTQLTAVDPQRGAAFWQLGRSQALLELYVPAESSLRRCMELEPGNVAAGLALADLLAADPEAGGQVLLDLLRQPLSAQDVERVQSALLQLR